METGIIPPQPFPAQTLTSFALGSKNRFLDNTMQVNVEAYHYDYHDFHAAVTKTANLSYTYNGVTYTDPDDDYDLPITGGNTHVDGLEVETKYLFTPRDQVSVSTELAYGRYGKLIYTDGAGQLINITGQPLTDEPAFKATVDYQHTFEDILGGSLLPRATVQYTGRFYNTTEREAANAVTPGFWNVNAYLNYTPNRGNWSVNAYVRNLTDEYHITAAGYPPPGAIYSISDPRTFGAGFNYSF